MLTPQHPEWKTKEPFASLLKVDLKTALASDDHNLGAVPQPLYEQAKKDGWTVVSMKNEWKQVCVREQVSRIQ